MAARFRTAREMLEAAREASLDALRIGRQLRAMEERAAGLGGGGLGARVGGTGEPDRMGARVAAMVDHEARLEERLEEDYRLIDAACEVLYGDGDAADGGLWAIAGWRADAIFHHYLALRTWEETAALVGYSTRYVLEQVAEAFRMADDNGDFWTRLGRGREQGGQDG